MFHRRLYLALAASLLVIASAQLPRCGDMCAFRFCQANGFRTVFAEAGPRLLLRDANVASHPFVCRKVIEDPRTFFNRSIRVNKVGQAEVHPAALRGESPRPFVKISKFSPSGLSPKFGKKYFTLREINRFPPIPGEKGISRQMSTGNQEDFVDDLCVKIPVTSYDLLNEDLTLDKRIRRTSQPEDCVSFRSLLPKILIELTWDSSDDFDLSVKEPNGEKINFNNDRSGTGGRLINDQNVGRCGLDPDGREQIRWLVTDSPDVGKYVVTVKHFKNCGNGPTNWSLAVIINGKAEVFKTGTSNKDDNKKVVKAKFNLS